jgi:hypothetical protein
VNLKALAETLGLENLTPEVSLDAARDIGGGYASDLLSDVLANAPRGGILITIQVHLNVIAVAVHAELAAVIFTAGRRPEEDVRSRAAQEGIALFTTELSAFDMAGQLYTLGLRGTHE